MPNDIPTEWQLSISLVTFLCHHKWPRSWCMLGGQIRLVSVIATDHQLFRQNARLHSTVTSTPDCNSRARKLESQPNLIFHGDWSWSDFHGHSPHFTDPKGAVFSYWQKCLHLHVFLADCVGSLSLHRDSVCRLNDQLDMTLIVLNRL